MTSGHSTRVGEEGDKWRGQRVGSALRQTTIQVGGRDRRQQQNGLAPLAGNQDQREAGAEGSLRRLLRLAANLPTQRRRHGEAYPPTWALRQWDPRLRREHHTAAVEHGPCRHYPHQRMSVFGSSDPHAGTVGRDFRGYDRPDVRGRKHLVRRPAFRGRVVMARGGGSGLGGIGELARRAGWRRSYGCCLAMPAFATSAPVPAQAVPTDGDRVT